MMYKLLLVVAVFGLALSVSAAPTDSVDDLKMTEELLNLLPSEVENLDRTRRTMAAEIARNKAKLSSFDAHSMDHQATSLLEREARLMQDIEESKRQIAALNQRHPKRSYRDELAAPRHSYDKDLTSLIEDEADISLEPNNRVDVVKNIRTVQPTASPSSSCEKIEGCGSEKVEAEEKPAAAPSTTTTTSSSSSSTGKRTVSPVIDPEYKKDIQKTSETSEEPTESSSDASEGEKKGETVEEAAAAGKDESSEGSVHKFDGIPQTLHFKVGPGMLECQCQYKEPERNEPEGCALGANSSPYVPADASGLSGVHCYEVCQEHKCRTLFKEGGFDVWHTCVNSCVKTCFHGESEQKEEKQEEEESKQDKEEDSIDDLEKSEAP